MRQAWVDRATAAIQNFGAVSRKEAKSLLLMWTHYPQLSRGEIREVLRNFR